MAIDKVQGRNIPNWADRNKSNAQRLDAATYIGIVKNNVDSTRSGRLQVWIPEFGALQNDTTETNPVFWRTVNYASPFFGSTFQKEKSVNNTYEEANQTYGMWFVPPDVGNQVLCTFVNGDPNRGYWFACISPTLSHYMVPGIAAGNQVANASPAISKSIVKSTPPQSLPVTEFNENEPDAVKSSFYENKKPIHNFQANVLFKQGLDRDSTRGAISSSSQRESPSKVFGISTPGRPFGNDPADDPTYQEKLAAGKINAEDYAVKTRKGGHQFVMDDGDINGRDQLVRLRSAAGHQILMHDSQKVMYIANSEGSVWIELAESGHMHIYTAGGFNLRSEGDLNFHGRNIRMQAESDFNLSAGGGFNVSSSDLRLTGINGTLLYGGKVNIGAGGPMTVSSDGVLTVGSSGAIKIDGSTIDLNGGDGGGNSITPAILQTNKHDDTTYDEKTRLWSTVQGAATSIVSVMPAHEPWARNASTLGQAPEKQVSDNVCPPKSGSAGNIPGIADIMSGDYATIAAKIISSEEGLVEKAIKDYGGRPSFGYGHNIQTNEVSQGYVQAGDEKITLPANPFSATITKPQAIKLLTYDITATFASRASKALGNNWNKLNDTQKAVLVSYAYNTGSTISLVNAGLNDAIASGNTAAAAAIIRDKGIRTAEGKVLPGLVTRRAKEATMFESQPLLGTGNASGASTSTLKNTDGNTVTDGSNNPVKASGSDASTDKKDLGITRASGVGISDTCPVEYLTKPEAYNPPGEIGTGKPKFTQLQAKAMHAELGYFESKWAYDLVKDPASEDTGLTVDASGPRIGKYQVDGSYLAAETRGYIKPDALDQFDAGTLANESSWTGKDKINSQDSFMQNKIIQDTVQFREFNENYLALKANGGILEMDDICVAAGMLFVAHQMRSADKAKEWRDKGELRDARGVSGAVYFNHGRYAIDVLSASVSSSTGGVPATTGGENVSGINPDDVFTFTSSGSGTRANFDALNGEFKTQICKMGKAYKDKTGSKIAISSAYRSQESQTVLYESWVAHGGSIPGKPEVNVPGIGRIITPSRTVGSHSGVAIDSGMMEQVVNTLGATTISELGLRWGGTFSTPDRVHIQLANYR
jgi:GH24 family phage-related lysozyme (muramidase)